MIIIRIIASFRKQGEINVSRTVLPAPAAPVMSCKGGGEGREFYSPSISDCLWATAPVALWCDPSTHGLCQEVHKVMPDMNGETVATCWLWRADAWKPRGMSLKPHLVSLQPAGTQLSPPLCSGCAEGFPGVSALSQVACMAVMLCHCSLCCMLENVLQVAESNWMILCCLLGKGGAPCSLQVGPPRWRPTPNSQATPFQHLP